jgi:hypothetical protein
MKRIWLTALVPIAVALVTIAPLPAVERACTSPTARTSSIDRGTGGEVPGIGCTALDIDRHFGQSALAPAAASTNVHFPVDPRAAFGLLLAFVGLSLRQRGLRIGQHFIPDKPP